MSRTLTLLAALLVVIAASLIIRHQTSDLHTLPSVKEVNETSIDQNSFNFHEWREFSFEHGNFKVLLPALPQHVSDTFIDPTTHKPLRYETYTTAADNGAAFMINAIIFSTPGEAEAREESLKAIVNEMLDRNKENKLNEMQMSTFRGVPALNFSFSSGDVLVEGKVFAHQNTIYILSMIKRKDVFNQKELDFFVNSFYFKDEKEKETPTN